MIASRRHLRLALLAPLAALPPALPACSGTVLIDDDGPGGAPAHEAPAAEPGGAGCEPCAGDSCALCPQEAGRSTWRCTDSAAAPAAGCHTDGSLWHDSGGYYLCMVCDG